MNVALHLRYSPPSPQVSKQRDDGRLALRGEGNIHAVGESLSRSCNIRLPRYLPHFRAFHFAPARSRLVSFRAIRGRNHFYFCGNTFCQGSRHEQRQIWSKAAAAARTTPRCLFIFPAFAERFTAVIVRLRVRSNWTFPSRNAAKASLFFLSPSVGVRPRSWQNISHDSPATSAYTKRCLRVLSRCAFQLVPAFARAQIQGSPFGTARRILLP